MIMKNNNIARLAFILAAMMLFASCGETYMEENQNAYEASDVIPIVLSVSGPSVALQTFVYDLKITYDRAGSTWSWSSADATIQSVSADTKTATVLFDQLPASGKAYIDVTETTSGGKTSAVKSVEIPVEEFCPLDPSGFVGSWSGTDGMDLAGYFFDSQVVISNSTATTVDITGLNFGWMVEVWGESIEDGGTATLIINPDGTCEIDAQWYMQTMYGGDPYDYYIEGSGTWSNCGASPALNISYVVYYDDGYTLPGDWASGYDFFYAIITLDGSKGAAAMKVMQQTPQSIFPPKRKFD